MKKKQYYELDLIRAVCAVIVVCYHFTCALDIFQIQGFKNVLYLYPNGRWGEMAVSVFFMISGAVMLYNYGERQLAVSEFYKKRWISLFPMFYIMWILMYVIRAVTYDNWFWGGNPRLILLSLLGMDGYFYYLQPNYHSIGEWFLGAIIFLYLLYPALRHLFQRYRWQTTACVTGAWILIFVADWFKIGTFYNIITCVWSFWTGMLLMEYRGRWKKWGPVFGVTFLVLLVWKLPISETVGMNVTAIALFGLLFLLGKPLMKCEWIKKAVLSVSRNSYGIFLTHHVIIDGWVKTKRYGQISFKEQMLWMAASLVVAYISAVLLRNIAEALQQGVKWSFNRIKAEKSSH